MIDDKTRVLQVSSWAIHCNNVFCLQSRRCVDAGKQAISGVWVFVHGFEALYGHYSKWTVYGQNACQGLYPIFIFLESLGVKGNIKINQW